MSDLQPTREFLDASEAAGIAFDPGDIDRLAQFLGLMLETNKTHNLTAITDPAQAWMKHIFDSLTLIPVLSSLSPVVPTNQAQPESPPANVTVIDIGSGGGLPSLPLAIVLPDIRFTLVEATGKKADFLRTAAKALNLSNVRVIQERAEKIGQDHKVHREHYDLAMARALGHLAVLTELCGPLVRKGGILVAIKGAKAEQELAEAKEALTLIGLRHTETIPTPTGRLVLLEKVINTPRLYPRRDGEPARVPLGMSPKSATK